MVRQKFGDRLFNQRLHAHPLQGGAGLKLPVGSRLHARTYLLAGLGWDRLSGRSDSGRTAINVKSEGLAGCGH
jgi:hypothetical protein